MLDPGLLARTAHAACTPADLFADVFAEQTVIGVCEVTPDDVVDLQTRALQGASVRRVGPTVTAQAHTAEWSEASIAALVQVLGDDVRARTLRSENSTPATLEPPPLADLERIAYAAAVEARRAGGVHVSPHATLRTVRQRVVVARSDGRVTDDVRDYVSIRIDCVVRHGAKLRTSRRSAGAANLAQLIAADQHLALGRMAAEACLQRLDAVAAPAGDLPVVLGPGGPATLVHETCGHALEADVARYARSSYHGRLGQSVASPLVTVVDDPAPLGQVALFGVDDEGVPAQPVVLIERGILRSYLVDRRHAALAGQTPNGHARRLNYAYPPLPRTTTTYILPGSSSPAEIIADTPRGIYVESIAGGDTDTSSGRFNLQVDEGFLIENGRCTAPIRGAMLSGYGPDVLSSIDRVGNDLQFLNLCHVCNKLDQFPLLVSVGQPTVRVANMRVWGG